MPRRATLRCSGKDTHLNTPYQLAAVAVEDRHNKKIMEAGVEEEGEDGGVVVAVAAALPRRLS